MEDDVRMEYIPEDIGSLGQGRVYAKVQTKYNPKSGWFMVKMVTKTRSHTEIVMHKTGCIVETTPKNWYIIEIYEMNAQKWGAAEIAPNTGVCTYPSLT